MDVQQTLQQQPVKLTDSFATTARHVGPKWVHHSTLSHLERYPPDNPPWDDDTQYDELHSQLSLSTLSAPEGSTTLKVYTTSQTRSLSLQPNSCNSRTTPCVLFPILSDRLIGFPPSSRDTGNTYWNQRRGSTGARCGFATEGPVVTTFGSVMELESKQITF